MGKTSYDGVFFYLACYRVGDFRIIRVSTITVQQYVN